MQGVPSLLFVLLISLWTYKTGEHLPYKFIFHNNLRDCHWLRESEDYFFIVKDSKFFFFSTFFKYLFLRFFYKPHLTLTYIFSTNDVTPLLAIVLMYNLERNTLSFYKHQVNLVQFQICLGYFKF